MTNIWADLDPNVRVRGNQTFTGYESLHGGTPRRGQTIRLVETESGINGEGIVTDLDEEKRLVYVAVDWSRLHFPDGTERHAAYEEVTYLPNKQWTRLRGTDVELYHSGSCPCSREQVWVRHRLLTQGEAPDSPSTPATGGNQ